MHWKMKLDMLLESVVLKLVSSSTDFSLNRHLIVPLLVSLIANKTIALGGYQEQDQ